MHSWLEICFLYVKIKYEYGGVIVDAIQINILHILKNNTVMTSSELSQEVNLSEKTVRTRIKTLSYELNRNGADIIATPGKGFELVINDIDIFNSWFESLINNDEIVPTTYLERVDYLLSFLLNTNEYIKMEDLSDLLYVSRNTVTSDLKRVEIIVGLYNLEVIRRPNYGVLIKGSEINKRKCIANQVFKNELGSVITVRDKEMIKNISNLVADTIRTFQMRMHETSFESLLVYIYIMIKRTSKGNTFIYDRKVKEDLLKTINDKSASASKEIARQLMEKYNHSINNDEILLLALHLSGKTSTGAQGEFGNNLVISSKIDELVLKMLNSIYEIMRLDFRDNLELRMSLNQHMVPFDIRLRYDIPLKNPLIDQIKNDFTLAYTVAATGCTVLSKHYNKEIPDDEVAYFAILFALIMERKETNINKYNIIVVCASGRGSSSLFMYRYKQAFGKYINNIYEASIFELEELDFKQKEIDYVFTTIPINFNLPIPVFEISLLLDNKEIETYQRILEHGDSNYIHRYFDEKLFLPNLKSTNKEEAIKEMCKHIQLEKEVPTDFYDLIMFREEMGQTDFGNYVAIPHPYKVVSDDIFVTVAILEEPLWWGNNEVQVVFLI